MCVLMPTQVLVLVLVLESQVLDNNTASLTSTLKSKKTLKTLKKLFKNLKNLKKF